MSNEITVNASRDRKAWLQARRGALGASEIAAILGLNPRTTPWEIWADKTGRLEDEPTNRAQAAGLWYERAVLDYAETIVGEVNRDVRVRCSDAPIASTCDAITVADHSPVEAKTTGLTGPVFGEWGDEGTDSVPDYYAVQVHTQLLCTGADLGHLFALVAGRGTVHYEIERNDRIADTIKQFASQWWEQHVVGDTPPPVEPTSFDVVKRLKREPGKVFILSSSDLVDRYEAARQARLDAAKLEDAAKAALLAAIDDAELAEVPDGRRVTYAATTVKRKAQPAREYEQRTLRVKKAAKKRQQ